MKCTSAMALSTVLLRLWNKEVPLTERYDALDLFSGKMSVKAGWDMMFAEEDLGFLVYS